MQSRAEFQAWARAAAVARRRAARWQAAAVSMAVAAGALTLIAVTDRLLLPSGWPLVVMAAAPIAMAAVAAGWLAMRAASLEPPAVIAARADAERPDLQDRAKTAADLLDRQHAGAFDDLVLGETARGLSTLHLPETFNEQGGARGRRGALAAGVALAIAAGAAWPAVRDAATTARVLLVPGALEISVTPGHARVPIGKTFAITARASVLPRTPGRARPVLTIETPNAAGSGEMIEGDDAFTYVTAPVTESFTYRVTMGPAVSETYQVEALPYPNVQGIDLSYTYPSWSGLDPRSEQDGGDVYGPQGTRVRMRVRVDKPSKEAALVMADGSRIALAGSDDGRGHAFETALTLERDGAYRVAVVDRDGLENPDSTEYFIRLVDDAPPDVRIVRPAGDQRVTPLAEVAVEARADDDHGIRDLEIVYAVRGGDERVVPVGPPAGRTATGRHLIYLEDLDVRPGDFVSYYARARDVARGRQSTEARSDIFFLEVKPFEEEFAAAQSMAQAGAGAASRRLQSLAAAQKEIIVATWKLERRAGAGRSAADLRAVADAQRELRQRTAQAAAELGPQEPPRQRRRGRGQLPAEPTPVEPAQDDGDDAAALLSQAGDAMDAASRELDARSPSRALDHENAALNALLRLEAQVRRREIVQAQNQGGGGGGGGGNQDLSALFDRELQRQQRTNYETRSAAQASEQEGEQESEALRRVREMAARQEAMRREQEALARANVSAEERRRRLERLRRDQEELQRQAAQLAEELRQQGQQAASPQSQRGQEGGRRGQTRGEAGEAGAAAEAMSGAAESLERDDLQQAERQSAQAGERLRELERALGSRSPRASAQAMNDARLEARQLADAQRRLAADAARAGEGAGAEAARRFAAEKERSAERLDALGRRLAEDPAAAREARRLAEEQREGARAWQQAEAEADAPSGQAGEAARDAQAGEAREARMAEAIGRLAERLGAPPAGAGEADARRLVDELQQARDARERLADLDRRIQDLRRQLEENAAGTRGAEGARELAELESAFAREARQASQGGRTGQPGGARDGREGGGTPNQGRSGTPEQAGTLSRSAPGTEQWKQDFSRWESMREGVVQAIEAREAEIAARLAERFAAERLHGGHDARTPEAWRQLVAEYYQAIAARRPR